VRFVLSEHLRGEVGIIREPAHIGGVVAYDGEPKEADVYRTSSASALFMTNDHVGRPSEWFRQREFPDVVVLSAIDNDVMVGVANSESGGRVSGSIA
jgi:hypothetical protein